MSDQPSLAELTAEIRTLSLETRAEFAELRVDVAMTPSP